MRHLVDEITSSSNSISTSFTNIYSHCLSICLCVQSDQRQFDCSTNRESYEISRRKWILLFEQQISLLNVLIEEKIVRCQSTYLYTRECLLSLLLHLIESIVFLSPSLELLSRSTRLLYGVCRMCHHSSAYRWRWWTTEMVTPNDTICSMYQLKQYWKKKESIYNIRFSIIV
jgi:hypothetical protein